MHTIGIACKPTFRKVDVSARLIVIAFISQKGGTGKTTLAIHLATAFVAGGYNTAVLDHDPQASAAEWKDARADEKPPVMAVPDARLQEVIEEMRPSKRTSSSSTPHPTAKARHSPPPVLPI